MSAHLFHLGLKSCSPGKKKKKGGHRTNPHANSKYSRTRDNDSMSPASTNKPAACEGAGGGLHRGATVRISHIGQASQDVVMGFAAAAHSFPRAKQLGRAAERKEKTRASVSF